MKSRHRSEPDTPITPEFGHTSWTPNPYSLRNVSPVRHTKDIPRNNVENNSLSVRDVSLLWAEAFEENALGVGRDYARLWRCLQPVPATCVMQTLSLRSCTVDPPGRAAIWYPVIPYPVSVPPPTLHLGIGGYWPRPLSSNPRIPPRMALIFQLSFRSRHILSIM